MKKYNFAITALTMVALIGCGNEASKNKPKGTTIPATSIKLEKGSKYTPGIYGNDSEAPLINNGQIGISLEDYKKLCEANPGITKWGTQLMAPGYIDRITEHLMANGEITDIRVFWNPNGKKGRECRVEVDVQGLYQGSDYKKTATGEVSSFIISDDGKLLIMDAYQAY